MLNKDTQQMIDKSRDAGWVLEPDAKAFLKSKGLDIPDSVLTDSFEIAERFMKTCRTPVVVKAVSKKILHKTEHHAVVVGIDTSKQLQEEMTRLLGLDGCQHVLVEQMVQGIEVIVGSKNDFQFGPVVVFGMGGTSVEIYNDTAIRMAPLKPEDVLSMIETLQARELIKGYRGKDGVNIEVLTQLLVSFSQMVMDLEDHVESIDLNPVICTEKRCVIADARIVLETD